MLRFEDKILIRNLWECKRFSARRLLKEFPNKNWKPVEIQLSKLTDSFLLWSNKILRQLTWQWAV